MTTQLVEAVAEAWEKFLQASVGAKPDSPVSPVGGVANTLALQMPIDWPAFYEFIIEAHLNDQVLEFDHLVEMLEEAGLSGGEAEDVAGAYWIGREVLRAFKASRGELSR